MIFWKLGFKETINVSLFAMGVSDIGSLVSLFWMGICYNPIFADSDISFDSRSVQYLTGGWPKFYLTRISGLITAYVTFERCLCTVIPLKVKSMLTPKRVSVIIAVIFTAIALTVSPIYVYTQFGQRWNSTLVGLIFSANKETVNSITLGLSVLLCDGSFLFVAAGTVILVLNLKKSLQWKETAARTSDKRLSKETKASKMVTFIAVVFITCL
ncbi:unnamed protein product [Lymnaea stagnalis]|uniref:G-protein coupled receptors family 1 profile domain-containing protein n=1 Tax=Lymnaea stagnalis TaxID=6523 RepID=A0AAV2IBY9_LYMST